MDWIDVARNSGQWKALVNTVMSLKVPQDVGKFLSNCTTGDFSRNAQLHGVSYIFMEFFTQGRPLTFSRITLLHRVRTPFAAVSMHYQSSHVTTWI
jgi:hypothetical protein